MSFFKRSLNKKRASKSNDTNKIKFEINKVVCTKTERGF
jgi:hypothetical protein